MNVRPRLFLLAAVSVISLGCNTPPLGGGCRLDSECEPLKACLAAACVPRESPRVLHVVAYPALGAVAAPSELSNVPFSPSAPVNVTMLGSVIVAGKAASPSTAPFALLMQGELGISVQLPSLVRGAPALDLNTVAFIKGAGGVADFSLAVPANRAGELGAITLVPRAPADAAAPPLNLRLPLVSGMVLPIPGAADLRTIEGRVHTEFNLPPVGYVAQVMRNGQVVSNRAPLAEDGRFRVSFPKPQDAASDVATLLVSLPGQAAVPHLQLELPATATDVETLKFPAHPKAQPFRVPVVAVDAMGVHVPVAGALVRFETRLASTGPGLSSRYVQELQSGKDGTVDIPLIAGGLERPRQYSVEVTSPSFSEAGSRCIPNFAVGPATAGTISVPTAAVIELQRRPALAGVLKRADQSTLRAAVITAVRLGPVAGVPDCAVPNRLGDASTISDAAGNFRLRVDAGTFRIEVRPPTGELVPFTALDAVVTNDGLAMDIVMPAGRLAEGKLLTSVGAPCAACRVLIYEGALTAPAVLRAETVSGPDGLFRFILPAL